MERQKILCVDDNLDNLVTLEAVLGEVNADIVTVDEGSKAVTLVSQSDFALIILDVQMKWMDGYEVAEKIKTIERARNIPIIFLSAVYYDDKHIMRGYQSGAVDFITKPFNSFLLESKVKVFLQLDKMRKEIQEKADLEKSKDYLDSILNSTREAIIVINFDSLVIKANDSALTLWEYSGIEMENLDASNLIDSDSFLKWLKNLKHFKATGDLNSIQLRDSEIFINTRFGNMNPAIITCSPLLDLHKNVIGGVITATDLSERKFLEKALWENEEKLRYISAFANDALLMIDPKGKINFWNKAATRIFGYTDEEVFGIDLHSLLAPKEFHEAISKGFSHFLSTGEGNALNKTIEVSALRKSGEEFPIELSISSIRINNKWNAVGIIRDISERKLAERKIIESEAYYRTLVETSPDAIMTTDFEGKITFASKKSCELFGVENNEDIINTSLLRWVDPLQHERVVSRFGGIFQGSYKPDVNEYRLFKFDGTPFFCEVSSSPILNSEGNISGLLIICHDVTERNRSLAQLVAAKEKAEESERLKTAFIRNISHEIRTPMNAIVGFSNMLDDPDQTPDSKKIFTDSIIESTNQLLLIVTDLIEISNIEAKIIKLNNSQINPGIILKHIAEKFSSKAVEKGLSLKVENECINSNKNVRCDISLLDKILEQLLANAIKFTSSGEILIRCREINGKMEFTVKDSGIGIPEEFQRRIFDPFYQVETELSRDQGGTGLGLTITKAYLELLGSSISLKSKSGEGSEFSFSLPLSLQATENKLKSVPDEDIHGQKSKTILIAEDDDNNYNLITAFLRGVSYNFIRAENGAKAVDFCNSGIDINLVLMDLRMPVMDGYEATRIIRGLHPHLPVIVQTAYSDDIEKIKDCGSSGLIFKPFEKHQLLSLIQEYI
jgi:PAS domain S-box-containing protein